MDRYMNRYMDGQVNRYIDKYIHVDIYADDKIYISYMSPFSGPIFIDLHLSSEFSSKFNRSKKR